MAKVQLNTPAPDFTLADFNGHETNLSHYRGENHILLIFNRGFM